MYYKADKAAVVCLATLVGRGLGPGSSLGWLAKLVRNDRSLGHADRSAGSGDDGLLHFET
jgi:hypothetical protein